MVVPAIESSDETLAARAAAGDAARSKDSWSAISIVCFALRAG